MADPRLLPAGIDDARSRAMLELIERLGAIDLTPLLVLRIDSTVASAFARIAEYFDVLGLEGYDLADTEEKKRELLRRALELHRYKGTPWAVKEALKALDYDVVEIDETVGRRRYDGRYRHNAEITYASGQSWAVFRVVVRDLPDDRPITADEQVLVIGIINEFKPARSALEKLTYFGEADDAVLGPSDGPLGLITAIAAYSDGEYLSDGTVWSSGEELIPEVLA